MLVVVMDGMALGVQLAVLAVGLTLVFGLGGVLNLAHGQLVVVAAAVTATMTAVGWPIVAAAPAGVLAAAVLATLLDLTVLRVVYRRQGRDRVLTGLLITLGIAFAIDGLLVSWRPNFALAVSVPAGPVEILGVRLRAGTLVATGVALVAIVAVWLLLTRTRTGKVIRAVAQDEVAAGLCGIDVSRPRRLVVALSGALAGVVALTQAVTSSVAVTDGFSLTVMALIVAVVGGLRRVGPTIAAGLVLGIAHAAATHLLGAVYTTLVLLLAAIVAILLRRAPPAGSEVG